MENNNLNNEQNNMMNNDQEPREIIVEQPKSNVLLITFLLLIIFALAGYIIWDKLISKDEKNPTEVKEPDNSEQVLNPEEEEKPSNTTYNYIKTEKINKTINEKNVNIEIKYRLEKLEITLDEDGEETNGYIDETVGYILYADLYFNGKFVKNVGHYSIIDSLKLSENDALKKLENNKYYDKFLKLVQRNDVVKGDKDYLCFRTATDSFIVINDNAEIILEKLVAPEGRGVYLNKNCKNYQNFVEQFEKDTGKKFEMDTALYYVGDNFIYYVEDNGSCGGDDDKLPQYKITFNNNKANLEKIADCKYEFDGACG